jgi:hypothetical protein
MLLPESEFLETSPLIAHFKWKDAPLNTITKWISPGALISPNHLRWKEDRLIGVSQNGSENGRGEHSAIPPKSGIDNWPPNDIKFPKRGEW